MAQEAIIRLYQHADRINRPDVTNYALQIASNIITDYARRRTRKGRVVLVSLSNAMQFGGDYIDALVDREPEPSIAAIDTRNAVDQLRYTDRRIMLALAEGLRRHEIANRVGIPVGTVRSRIHRARKRLSVIDSSSCGV